MKPLKEYLAMTSVQLLEEPDAPESLKIGSQIAMENAERAQYELTEAARLERMAYERAAQQGPDRQETSR